MQCQKLCYVLIMQYGVKETRLLLLWNLVCSKIPPQGTQRQTLTVKAEKRLKKMLAPLPCVAHVTSGTPMAKKRRIEASPWWWPGLPFSLGHRAVFAILWPWDWVWSTEHGQKLYELLLSLAHEDFQQEMLSMLLSLFWYHILNRKNPHGNLIVTCWRQQNHETEGVWVPWITTWEKADQPENFCTGIWQEWEINFEIWGLCFIIADTILMYRSGKGLWGATEKLNEKTRWMMNKMGIQSYSVTLVSFCSLTSKGKCGLFFHWA